MKNHSEQIDVNKFRGLLQEADRAYRSDVSYSIAMCNSARSIESKREVWKLRLELREAAKKAQQECRRVEPFKCDNVAPCGLGSCRFAEGDMVFLQEPSAGSTTRPQKDSKGTYGLENVVELLRELRADSTDLEE